MCVCVWVGGGGGVSIIVLSGCGIYGSGDRDERSINGGMWD